MQGLGVENKKGTVLFPIPIPCNCLPQSFLNIRGKGIGEGKVSFIRAFESYDNLIQVVV